MKAIEIALVAALFSGSYAPARAEQTVPPDTSTTQAKETSPDWNVAPRFKRARGLPPLYPMSYIREQKPGWATIRYTVGVDGKATGVVMEAASEPAFGNHVASAIRVWPHFPASKSGVPVEATVTRTFSLEME